MSQLGFSWVSFVMCLLVMLAKPKIFMALI